MDQLKPIDISPMKFEELPKWSSESKNPQGGQQDSQPLVDIAAYFVAGVLLFLFIVVIKKIKIWVGFAIARLKQSNFSLDNMSHVTQLRKMTIYITWVIVTLMMLFPPWSETTRYLARPLGYGFIFIPPEATSSHLGVSIDYGRLALQWSVTISIAGFLLMFKLKKEL